MFRALLYLSEHFFYHIIEFLRHWYVKSAKLYANFVLNRLEALDYYLAWRITAKNLFEPLYKDYSVIGRMLGFVFRSIRLIVGSVVYACLFAVAIALYLVWVAIPPYLVLKVISG